MCFLMTADRSYKKVKLVKGGLQYEASFQSTQSSSRKLGTLTHANLHTLAHSHALSLNKIYFQR